MLPILQFMACASLSFACCTTCTIRAHVVQRVTLGFQTSLNHPGPTFTLTAAGDLALSAAFLKLFQPADLPQDFNPDVASCDAAVLKQMCFNVINKVLGHAKPASIDLIVLVRHGLTCARLIPQRNCGALYVLLLLLEASQTCFSRQHFPCVDGCHTLVRWLLFAGEILQ